MTHLTRVRPEIDRPVPNPLSRNLLCLTTARSNDVGATELTTLQSSTSRVRASEQHGPPLEGACIHHKYSSVMMRKPDTALIAARNPPRPSKYRERPEELVCIALLFAMFAIAFRIAIVW